MKKIIGLISLIGLVGMIGLYLPQSAYAFDRKAKVAGARSIVNANYTYNVTTVIITAGSSQVGSSDRSLPAYQQINNIIAQIELLKKNLKSRS